MDCIEGYSRYRISWKWVRGPHVERKLSKRDAKSLLVKGVLFVRNTFDFDCAEETAYWHIIKDSFRGIEEVPSKHRSAVKKSIEKYEFKLVSKDYAIKNFYETYKEASEHYRVKAQVLSKEQFVNHITSLDDSYDLWTCIHKETGKIAGFAINHIIDGMCDYVSMKYHPDYLKPVSPSYGLIFKMNEYYLVECGLKYVDDGARSITEHSEIQSFLISKFRFRKAYCHVRMIYKWWFGMIIIVLMPFRKMIFIPSIKAILNMEEIARKSQGNDN